MLWSNVSGSGMSSTPWEKSLNSSAANIAGYPTRNMELLGPTDAGV
jgi:hypothetical protein